MISESLLSKILEKFQTLSPEEFVELIVEHLNSRSDFSNVQPSPPKGRDKGVDIIAKASSPTGEPIKIAFQCKRYISKMLGSNEVSKTVQGMMRLEEADECVLVSTRNPSQDARDVINVWRQKGIRINWKQWCGRGLALNLVEKTPSVLVRRFPELRLLLPVGSEYEYLCPSFEIVTPPPDISGLKADKFYNGYPPTWENLKAKYDIERTVYVRPGGIRERVLGLLDECGSLKTVALLGVAGTGKTTLLRRMGLDAALKGHLVLRLRDDWICPQLNLSKQIKDVVQASDSTVLVLIDDASDLFFEVNILEGTLRELEAFQRVILVLAEQPDRWSVAIRKIPQFVEGENYFWYGIHHLLQSECEALVDRILQYEMDGTLSHSYCVLSRAERLDLCQDIAERQLVIAMLQMRYGMRFRKIIAREYERIPMKEGKDAYAMVCYFNTYGIALSSTLLMRALDLALPTATQQFQDSTEGLFVENRLGLSARHIIIARTIARYALSSPEARKAALYTILSALDLDEEKEERIFLRIFTGKNMHRRLVSQLHRNSDLVRSLYRDLRASYGTIPPYFLKFIAVSQALAERILGNPEAARMCLKEAIQLDPKYAFAHRQYAWLEHTEGNWIEAAERAVHAAELAPENFLCIYHCGRILSLNTVVNFRRAKHYLKRAIELEPQDPKIIRTWEDYQAAERIIGYLSGLRDDELIPGYVFRELRPGLAFLRALHGPDSNYVRRRLKGDLRQMQEDARGELVDLYDKLGDIKVGENYILKALITCNIARLQYLEWYHRDEPHNHDQMEQLFKKSLELNERDPFTHCWYGTFLKEVRSDFAGALSEYEKALSLGNQSKNPRFHDHPLFLNNIALLIMEEVQKGSRQPDSLKEAKVLLEKAVVRVEETESNFFWPANSLSLCFELIREAGY